MPYINKKYKQECPICGCTNISGMMNTDGFKGNSCVVICAKCKSQYKISESINTDFLYGSTQIYSVPFLEDFTKKTSIVLACQLAIDYCTNIDSVVSKDNVFTMYQPQEGQRIFTEGPCYLKVVSVNGKILATGREDIIQWLEKRYKDASGEWFMDVENLRALEEGLSQFGCQIAQAHPFYIATQQSDVDTKDYEIKVFVGDEIEQFRGDERFDEAFLFEDEPKDEIGVAAYQNSVLLGMAGASSDSDMMWQIGINVMPEAENQGVGTMLVSLIKNEVLKRGKLPFYGTAMSHIASQRVALAAGFVPAWAELYCEEVDNTAQH